MDTSLQILLFIAVLIILAKALGTLTARFGLPLVLGELAAGIVLGPTLLDFWHRGWFSSPANVAAHPISTAGVFKVLADLGVVVLMFLAGLETDVTMMRAAVGPAFWSATGGVILPMAGGTAVARLAGLDWGEAVFLGTILTATSVSITAQTLMNLKKLQTRAGSTILGAAVIDDVLGLVVLSLVIAAEPRLGHSGHADWAALGMVLGRVAIFSVLAFGFGPRFVRWVFGQAKRLHGPHTSVAAALAVAFLFSFAASMLGGMAAITGAYLAGVFVAATPAHGEVIQELRSMTNAFFGPLFFVSIGLNINAWELGGRLGLFFLILAVAILGKVLGCGLGAWFRGFSVRDSLVVGVGMIPRGEVGLITASIGWGSGLVSPQIYSLVVVLVLVTTLVTPLVLPKCFGEEGSTPTRTEAASNLESVSIEL
ncbi:MAG: cation:proton antiporter [Terriglobia bacterium]